MTLQELINHGYIKSISRIDTVMGYGYEINVSPKNSCSHGVTDVILNTLVESDIDSAIDLINRIVEFDKNRD